MRAFLVFFPVLTAAAQMVANPGRLPETLKSFEGVRGAAKLNCDIQPIRPRLDWTFRFQTGYRIDLPLRQYAGKPQIVTTVLRVTPEGEEREPVWLLSRARVPAVPGGRTNMVAEFGGAYLVGEGRYRVDILITDQTGRKCIDDWSIRARLNDEVREVRPGLPAGAVDDISLRRWRRAGGPSDAPEARHDVSLLIHASAVSPSRVRMRGYDRMLLMSAAASMLERLPVRNVRLTIFTMDRQKEVYHTPDLTSATFREAVDSLSNLELAIVDYSTLKNRTGHIELLSDLLDRELAAGSEAVIFIGPLARWSDKVADADLPERGGATPVYYVQLRPGRFAASAFPDTISRAVRKLGGRTKEVYTPTDFAEAIQDIDRLLERSKTP
jgi:hypothetical protein